MLTHDVGTAECLEVGGPGMSLFLMLYVFAAGLDYDDMIPQIQCWTKGRSSTAVAEDLRPTAMVAEV